MMILKMQDHFYMMNDVNVVLKKFYKKASIYNYSSHFSRVRGFSVAIVDWNNMEVDIPVSRRINSVTAVVEYRIRDETYVNYCVR